MRVLSHYHDQSADGFSEKFALQRGTIALQLGWRLGCRARRFYTCDRHSRETRTQLDASWPVEL